MDTVIIAAATYLIYAMVVGFGAVWLWREHGTDKVRLALASVVGLIVVLVLIKICNAAYYDARPFVVDPSFAPLIEHAPDNGFPSDHASAAGLMAVLIVIRHRLIGIAFALAAIGVAVGRVAAGVHHVLDVAVGLGLGAIAAVVGIAVMTIVLRRTAVLERWSGHDAARHPRGNGDAGPPAIDPGDRRV